MLSLIIVQGVHDEIMSLVLNYNEHVMKCFELIDFQVLRAMIFLKKTKELTLEHLYYTQILIFSGYALERRGFNMFLSQIAHNLVWYYFILFSLCT